MITNNMEINKVLWCGDCGIAILNTGDINCSNCGKQMADIGFAEDKLGYKGQGGSVKPGLCACGEPRARKGKDEYGRIRYRTQCYKCVYQSRLVAKAQSCKICGIKPENSSDLHKDHIDGDRSNNKTSNIQTLCVECHKYKTKKQQDWKKKNAD